MENINIANIQWFPGHMTKTRRMIKQNLSLVDAVAEVLDARIPLSSQNPEISSLIGSKPRIIILNKSDMADQNVTQAWVSYFKKNNLIAVPVDCKSGKGIKNFTSALKNNLLAQLLQRRAQKGMSGRAVRIMIVGIPNVGKSSFINKIANSKRTKVEDRPGVTRTKQWVSLQDGIELLDMPGVLWPKFENQSVAHKLAFTGAIKDEVLDLEALSMLLLEFLNQHYPSSLISRYNISIPSDADGKLILELIGRKRGMLLPGGIVNTERCAITVLDEFRSAKIARISLESPEGCE